MTLTLPATPTIAALPPGTYGIPDPTAPAGLAVWIRTRDAHNRPRLRPLTRYLHHATGDTYRDEVHDAAQRIADDLAAARAHYATQWGRCPTCDPLAPRKLTTPTARRRGTCPPCNRRLPNHERRALAEAITHTTNTTTGRCASRVISNEEVSANAAHARERGHGSRSSVCDSRDMPRIGAGQMWCVTPASDRVSDA